MKRLLILTLTFIVLVSFKNKIENKNFNCQDHNFKSFKERADSLVSFMHQAQNRNSDKKNEMERKFFCAFPNSFKEMQEIFGFDDVKRGAPLYWLGQEVIQYFGSLTSIPKEKYYEKYININVNGIWEADNIRQTFGFYEKILSDIQTTSLLLSQRTDDEIKSVFRFIFDGPHPKNEFNRNIYIQLQSKIQDERLGKLLKESYNKLMEEDDGHGH